MSDIPAPRPPKVFPTVLVLLTIALLGVVVWFNYYYKLRNEAAKGRLPLKDRVETDPVAWVDQNGKSRQLDALKGKVVVWSYLYTTCPQGCAGVAEKMKELQDEFGSNPRFQLVSVSLYPEHDRPEVLKAWTDPKNYRGENWWFLTTASGSEADAGLMRNWMEKSFGIWAKKKSPEHIAKYPADVWDHVLVMAMSDVHGNVRTPTNSDRFWVPFHEAFKFTWYPRPISEDIRKLLEEAEKEAKAETESR